MTPEDEFAASVNKALDVLIDALVDVHIKNSFMTLREGVELLSYGSRQLDRPQLDVLFSTAVLRLADMRAHS